MLFPRGADTSDDANRIPYTRASSVSDYLADFSHLWKWKMRYLARSLGQNRDLAMLAGAECYTTGFDKGEEKENRASGRRLDDVIERALERGKISEKADYGTVIHALTEPGNDGNVEYEDVRADVASYHALCEDLGIVHLGTELFCANDRFQISGTFDNLDWVPGFGILVTDKKTSSEVHGEDFRIQLAAYADEDTDLYDWETNVRISLEDYIERKGHDPDLLTRDLGLIMWIKHGKTEIFKLDLAAGREALERAVWVRDNHRRGKHKWLVTDEIRESKAAVQAALLSRIAHADHPGTLATLWRQYKSVWTDEHTSAAKARMESL